MKCYKCGTDYNHMCGEKCPTCVKNEQIQSKRDSYWKCPKCHKKQRKTIGGRGNLADWSGIRRKCIYCPCITDLWNRVKN